VKTYESLHITIFHQKNYKQFVEPNYFIFGGEGADFKNAHSGLPNKEKKSFA